jgi:hypothetical protein
VIDKGCSSFPDHVPAGQSESFGYAAAITEDGQRQAWVEGQDDRRVVGVDGILQASGFLSRIESTLGLA